MANSRAVFARRIIERLIRKGFTKRRIACELLVNGRTIRRWCDLTAIPNDQNWESLKTLEAENLYMRPWKKKRRRSKNR